MFTTLKLVMYVLKFKQEKRQRNPKGISQYNSHRCARLNTLRTSDCAAKGRERIEDLIGNHQEPLGFQWTQPRTEERPRCGVGDKRSVFAEYNAIMLTFDLSNAIRF